MTCCYVKNYPRPQMVRKEWRDLNGTWQFRFDDSDIGEMEEWHKGFQEEKNILVPYSYETVLSGIHVETFHPNIWYQRKLDINETEWKNKEIILHFEGSDYKTKVWINGQFVGSHEGGYTRFSFPVASYLNWKDDRIVVKVEDSFDTQQLRGKQRWRAESFECWYVQTTGIWKSVWMEAVDARHFTGLKLTPDLKAGKLTLQAEVSKEAACGDAYVQAVIRFRGRLLNEVRFQAASLKNTISIDVSDKTEESGLSGIHPWSPENPCLYDLELKLFQEEEICDCIGSYFGMREIEAVGGNILLNGARLYQRLILDQGYWEESGLTPPSEEAIREDIVRTKELGFNGVRKHQKIEDERFLYWCDVLGLLVWCEAPSTYEFGDRAVRNCSREWQEIVTQNYNHPSIICWTTFNESWGIYEVRHDKKQQHFTESIYHLIKALDSTRLVIANDGWEHTVSDIITLHDYEESAEKFESRYAKEKNDILNDKTFPNLMKAAMAEGYAYKGQPVIISEYGGIALKQDGSGWGYGSKEESSEAFLERYEKVTSVIGRLPYVCGFCYTQLTDVQQEVNGLMDAKRDYKVDPGKIKKINEGIG